MSTLLRSSKFIRCFSTVYKNVSIRPGKLPNLVEKCSASCAVQKAQVNFTRPFAVEAYKERYSVERCLHNLDFEVRQKGRIAGKDIEDVIYAVKSTGEITSSQALLLIRCCGNLVIEEAPQKRTELAAKVMSTLKELNVPLDISHYNALLKVYLENRTEFSPFEFLQELEKNNIVPNRVTYQYLIGSFCINGDIVGATKILELMKENKIPINEIIFNYLIIGHSEANDIESAADIINIMKEKNIEPSAASYAALLCGYAKFGNIEKIREILSFCEKEEISLLDKDIMDIVFALTINGHTKHVDEIITKVKRSSGFNQDIVNLSFRLINEGHDDVAVKLIKSMAPLEQMHSKSGVFLIHFLLRHNQPIQRIVKVSKMMRDEGINDIASVTALREMLIRERKEDAIFLLKNMKESGLELRPHYFYPLFCQAGKAKDNKMVVNILRLMRSFGVPRGATTVRNFVTPNYQVKNLKHDFGTLLNSGVYGNILAEALFSELAIKGDFKSCKTLATNFYLSWDKRWTKWLVQALAKTGDHESFVEIHKHFYDCYLSEYKIISEDEYSVEEDETTVTEVDLQEKDDAKAETLRDFDFNREKEFGEYILKIIASNHKACKHIEPVVKGFLSNGIGIRLSFVESISELVKDNMSVELLQELASPDVKPQPVVKNTTFIEEFPTLRVVKPSSGRAEFSEEDNQFIYLVNAKLVDQAEAVFEKFRANNNLNKFRYANIVKLHCLTKNYEKAARFGDEMQANYPGEICEDFLSLYYVEALMHVDRYDDAIALLKSFEFLKVVPEQLFSSVVSRYISEYPDKLDKARGILDIGMEKNIVHPRQYYQILNEYLKKKDYESAVSLFSDLVKKYKFAIGKGLILREVVQSGNPELLEKVTNSLAETIGQINSLLDLVVAFAESNKPKQARRLLETPGLVFKRDKLSQVCSRFLQLGNDTAIECLINASRGMTKINRSILFDYYLDCHLKNDDPAKALNTWTQMQEEDVTPSDQFLFKLSIYLKGKGLPVPFSVKDGQFETSKDGQIQMIDSISKAITEGDFEKLCASLEYLLRSRRRIPFMTLNNYVRDEIVSKGDLNKLQRIRRIFPAMKSYTTWEAMTFLAYKAINKSNEYFLNKVEELIKKRQDNPLRRIPFRTLLGLSLEDSSLIKQIEKAEEIAKEQNVEVFSGVLQGYYIIKGNFEEAKKYPVSDSNELVSLLKNYAFVRRNTEILETLLSLKNELDITGETVGSMYADLLNIHKMKDDAVKMQDCLHRAVADNVDQYISKDLITFMNRRLKSGLSRKEDLIKRGPAIVFMRNFHTTRRFDSPKKLDSDEVEPEYSNRESSFFSNFKSYILQDCSPQIKFLMKDKISILKNTCYWFMKVNHNDEPKIEKPPKVVEEKKKESEEYDLVSHLIGFQSSSISTRGEKDWMKFLKDDSGLLFNNDKKPSMPNPKIRPQYKPPLINMPHNPEDVVIMDLIDEGSNEDNQSEKPTVTPTKANLEDLEDDLEVPQKSQSKDI